MRSTRSKELGHRPLTGRLLVVAVAALAVLPAAGRGLPGRPVPLPSRPAMYVGGDTAPGQVTAQNGKFWVGGQQVKLRGADVTPTWDCAEPTDADFAQIASWGMNFVRLQVRWKFIENTAPTQSGSKWTHYYDDDYITCLRNMVGWAYNHGIYVLIDNAGHSGPPTAGGDWWWPSWLYDAPYNSHHKNYTDHDDANTDYWTDSLQQQFTSDYLSHLAGQLASTPGVAGYEVINEPQRGNLLNSHDTTQLIMGVSLKLGQAVRAADPPRIVFFMTRGCCGEGTPKADYSGFTALTNVAQDVHDYLGGRWGAGLMMDPTDPSPGEVLQMVDRFTLDTGPYLGTTTAQVQLVQNYTRFLNPVGIPLLFGEFSGDPPYEPNTNNLMGTMTAAFNSQGVSWAVYSYNDAQFTMFQPDGSLQPWAPIVIAAAQAP